MTTSLSKADLYILLEFLKTRGIKWKYMLQLWLILKILW
jgi:hypothetical protein